MVNPGTFGFWSCLGKENDCVNACLLETLLEHTTNGIDGMRGKERCSTITTIVALQYASNIAFELLQRTNGKRLVANGPIFDKDVLKNLKKDFKIGRAHV